MCGVTKFVVVLVVEIDSRTQVSVWMPHRSKESTKTLQISHCDSGHFGRVPMIVVLRWWFVFFNPRPPNFLGTDT